MNIMLTSLYIHIPFCNQICTYCDFHKEMALDSKKEMYIDALIKEFLFHKDKYSGLETIYIGGGTPSSLSPVLLEKLLKTIKETIDLNQIKEYAIETNPNDINQVFSELISSYKINRVSVGVQTFNDNHLQFLGRTHKKEDIYKAIKQLHHVGIRNISIDLIFSLVNQTIDELESDLTLVKELDIKHISYYSLILEENTKLYYLYDKNEINMNSEDLEGAMYEQVVKTLNLYGFNQYEISNFSHPGYESLHNLTYWTNKTYLGIGSGAHSLYDNKRFNHIANVKEYIKQINEGDFDFHYQYDYQSLNDECMLGLRLTKGISIPDIETKYSIKLLERFSALIKFIDLGILEIIDEYLRFTSKGILLGNEVFKVFLEVA